MIQRAFGASLDPRRLHGSIKNVGAVAGQVAFFPGEVLGAEDCHKPIALPGDNRLLDSRNGLGYALH